MMSISRKDSSLETITGSQTADAFIGRRAAMGIALVAWGAAIAAGSAYGFFYEITPSATASAMEHWPGDAGLCRLSEQRPTLVMFLHPRCPCSRASLNELSVLMTRCQERLDAHVVFFRPSSVTEEWAKTDLWDSAARIPGVAVRLDTDGAEHRRFGAAVSGEAFVYRANGELLFHGGITAGRGHAGDNSGRLALEALLLAGDRGLDNGMVNNEADTTNRPNLSADSTPAFEWVTGTPTCKTSVFGCELESRNCPSSKLK